MEVSDTVRNVQRGVLFKRPMEARELIGSYYGLVFYFDRYAQRQRESTYQGCTMVVTL